MSKHDDQYRQAERAYLESEGIDAAPQMVELQQLGGSVRVVVAGEGPPVLFVPGVLSTGVVFGGLVAQLPEYRCIMIDRPGTGLSPVLPSRPTDLAVQKQVADTLLIDVLDGLGLDSCHVVCTSLGGWTTLRSAAAHPDRFSRISGFAWLMGARMSGSPLSMRVPAPKAALPRRLPAPRGMLISMLKSGGMRAAIEKGNFSEPFLSYMQALVRHTETFRNDSLYNPRPVTLRGLVDRVVHPPELLARISAPVHLFWGDDDPFGDARSARDFASQLPTAELQMVEGAGHAPWLDEPEMAVVALREHLAGGAL